MKHNLTNEKTESDVEADDFIVLPLKGVYAEKSFSNSQSAKLKKNATINKSEEKSDLDFDKIFEDGCKHFSKKRYPQAINCFNEIFACFETNRFIMPKKYLLLLNFMAEAFFKCEDIPNSIKYFMVLEYQSIILQAPNSQRLQATFKLSNVFLQIKSYQLALESLRLIKAETLNDANNYLKKVVNKKIKECKKLLIKTKYDPYAFIWINLIVALISNRPNKIINRNESYQSAFYRHFKVFDFMVFNLISYPKSERQQQLMLDDLMKKHPHYIFFRNDFKLICPESRFPNTPPTSEGEEREKCCIQ